MPVITHPIVSVSWRGEVTRCRYSRYSQVYYWYYRYSPVLLELPGAGHHTPDGVRQLEGRGH